MPLPPLAADLTGFDLLLSVARLGSVGRAAAEHRISQPAASARLRELERRIGLTLLHRTPRGSTLTETGALVADWARTAIDAADALAVGLAALRATHESRLTVAASQTVAEYLLPAWLVALRAAHPGLAVTLQAANSSDVAAAVLTGQVELGFVEGPDLPGGLHEEVVATDRLAVVVAPGHQWAKRRRAVTATELATTPLVSREAGSGTRRAFDQALGELTAAAPLLELSSTTAIKHAVAAGSGPAVLSSLAVTAELAAGTLVAVPTAVPLQRRLRAVWRAADQLIGPARDLYTIARRA
ncbi:LysR family transcriptional regulator [Paractinoplanes brasiliensis]|uniref:DNA-binding transcriptional LysR family regulator n=1 Tax=Paractinoplanes brasiliensis TaxID=52695 RepID=A0A4R6JRP1_9ACTN|nr:LysR family transcriptional regulator [Actinoplanes brasiliensis]TDO39323.1 DNA-binding transcriptional LysR family regulator [Actinoplanes brasiliensis]GID32656.1 transcriptional regulator [Actinoplanes brasiliensis]